MEGLWVLQQTMLQQLRVEILKVDYQPCLKWAISITREKGFTWAIGIIYAVKMEQKTVTFCPATPFENINIDLEHRLQKS